MQKGGRYSQSATYKRCKRGPIHAIGHTHISRCIAIDFRPPFLQTRSGITMQEDPEYRRLHQILVYRAHGFGPDLIGFGDCGFIVFVFADHHLPAQVSQLLELGL